MRNTAIIVCCILTCSCFSTSQEPERKPSGSDLSTEPAVIEEIRHHYEFENDGTNLHRVNARIRVQTQGGVQQLGLLVFGYSTAHENMEIDYVRVRKPAGVVVTATADNFQDLPSPIVREAPVYTDFREKHITVPALGPGDILEYQITTRTTAPLVPGQLA